MYQRCPCVKCGCGLNTRHFHPISQSVTKTIAELSSANSRLHTTLDIQGLGRDIQVLGREIQRLSKEIEPIELQIDSAEKSLIGLRTLHAERSLLIKQCQDTLSAVHEREVKMEQDKLRREADIAREQEIAAAKKREAEALERKMKEEAEKAKETERKQQELRRIKNRVDALVDRTKSPVQPALQSRRTRLDDFDASEDSDGLSQSQIHERQRKEEEWRAGAGQRLSSGRSSPAPASVNHRREANNVKSNLKSQGRYEKSGGMRTQVEDDYSEDSDRSSRSQIYERERQEDARRAQRTRSSTAPGSLNYTPEANKPNVTSRGKNEHFGGMRSRFEDNDSEDLDRPKSQSYRREGKEGARQTESRVRFEVDDESDDSQYTERREEFIEQQDEVRRKQGKKGVNSERQSRDDRGNDDQSKDTSTPSPPRRTQSGTETRGSESDEEESSRRTGSATFEEDQRQNRRHSRRREEEPRKRQSSFDDDEPSSPPPTYTTYSTSKTSSFPDLDIPEPPWHGWSKTTTSFTKGPSAANVKSKTFAKSAFSQDSTHHSSSAQASHQNAAESQFSSFGASTAFNKFPASDVFNDPFFTKGVFPSFGDAWLGGNRKGGM